MQGQILKKSYKNKKFKTSAPTLNKEFELPDGSNSVLGIQDYFHSQKSDNPSMEICVKK